MSELAEEKSHSLKVSLQILIQAASDAGEKKKEEMAEKWEIYATYAIYASANYYTSGKNVRLLRISGQPSLASCY